MLQEQQAPLAEQIEQLRKERDVAQSELTTARQEIAQLRRNTADLFRLRGEVARLRGEMAVRISAATNTPIFEVSADPTNAPSTQVNVKSRFIVGPADLLVRLGLPMEGATGVLTDVQFRGLQKTVEKSEEVTIGGSPEVTTVSGREAQVMSVNPETTSGSVRETVSTLGVIPAVRADGITIDLSVSVRLWETKPPSKEAEISINPPLSDTNPWTSAVVWDGQTVAISKRLNSAAAPRSPATTSDQLLVVFVSPTLIDPAGNRLHTEEELEDLLGRDRKR